MRLDALENYVRGMLATTVDEKIQHYREAVRLNPAFAEAWLELGKTYFGQRSYEQAIAAFEKIPSASKVAREANFYLGLTSYAHGDFDKAESSFEFVAARLPLAEVYNNLGVVVARRRPKKAVDDFERAIENDPSDPDYHFNLGVTLLRAGDRPKAMHELRAALDHRPNDSGGACAARFPCVFRKQSSSQRVDRNFHAERLTRNYEENAFRQMTTQMQGWASKDSLAPIRFPRALPRGTGQGSCSLMDSPLKRKRNSAMPLRWIRPAQCRSQPSRTSTMRVATQARPGLKRRLLFASMNRSKRIWFSRDSICVRIEWKRPRENINRALELEPGNSAAQDLKRTVAAKLAEKAQPLPQP